MAIGEDSSSYNQSFYPEERKTKNPSKAQAKRGKRSKSSSSEDNQSGDSSSEGSSESDDSMSSRDGQFSDEEENGSKIDNKPVI